MWARIKIYERSRPHSASLSSCDKITGLVIFTGSFVAISFHPGYVYLVLGLSRLNDHHSLHRDSNLGVYGLDIELTGLMTHCRYRRSGFQSRWIWPTVTVLIGLQNQETSLKSKSRFLQTIDQILLHLISFGICHRCSIGACFNFEGAIVSWA